jgi:archaellum component FlaC
MVVGDAVGDQCKDADFRKFMSFAPPEIEIEKRIEQTAEQLNRLDRLVDDGRRVVAEIKHAIEELQNRINATDDELRDAQIFIVRDEIRVRRQQLQREKAISEHLV